MNAPLPVLDTRVVLQSQPWPENSDLLTRPSLVISNRATTGIKTWFPDLFSGTVNASTDFHTSDVSGSPDVVQTIFYGNMSGYTNGKDHLECAMDNTAKALMKTCRVGLFIARGYHGAKVAIGETLAQQTFVHVDWV